jgi:uncharacterized protein
MSTNLRLRVSTGKKEFCIEWKTDEKILFVETKSNPTKGKANKEILKELKKLFGAEVKLISGFKSKEKILEINSPEKNVMEKILIQTNSTK